VEEEEEEEERKKEKRRRRRNCEGLFFCKNDNNDHGVQEEELQHLDNSTK
jgi:hypothetical protein